MWVRNENNYKGVISCF